MWQVPRLGQEQIKPADSTDPSVTERIRLLESELERQNAKLDQLQKTIAEQQQAIQALLEKLSRRNQRTKEAAVKEPEPLQLAAEPQAATSNNASRKSKAR